MPAALPIGFSSKHLTNAEKAQKDKAKASVTPSVKLKAPRLIRNNVNFYRIWKETLEQYKGTELLNALDVDMLTRYCIERYSLEDMYDMRSRKQNMTALLDDSINKLAYIMADGLILDEIGKANYGKMLDIIAVGMMKFDVDTTLKIETRIEAKTKMLNQMALALYMTPRARAGAVPNQPDKETEDGNAGMFN